MLPEIKVNSRTESARKPPMMAGFQTEENLTGRSPKKMCEKLWSFPGDRLRQCNKAGERPLRAGERTFRGYIEQSLDKGRIRHVISVIDRLGRNMRCCLSRVVVSGENVISIKDKTND